METQEALREIISQEMALYQWLAGGAMSITVFLVGVLMNNHKSQTQNNKLIMEKLQHNDSVMLRQLEVQLILIKTIAKETDVKIDHLTDSI